MLISFSPKRKYGVPNHKSLLHLTFTFSINHRSIYFTKNYKQIIVLPVIVSQGSCD